MSFVICGFFKIISGLPKQIRNDKPEPVRTNEKWSNENDAQKNVKENLRMGSQQLLGRDDEHRRRPSSGPGDRHRLDVRVVEVAVSGDGEEEAPSFDEPPFECRRPASEKSMYINTFYLLCNSISHSTTSVPLF